MEGEEAVQHTHGGNIWEAAERFGGHPDDYLDFSANINPLGPPPAVWSVLQSSLPAITRYPDPNSAGLCRAASLHFGVPASQVVAGNGAAELIAALPRLPGVERVIVVEPTFSQYMQAARRAGREVVAVSCRAEAGFQIEPSAVLRAARSGDMVFICRPNNPTGSYLPDGPFSDLVQTLCERGAWPVVDESFLGFVRGGVSGVRLLRQGYPVTLIHSLTKLYALPGLRLGVALLPEQLGRALERELVPWRVNALADSVGQACLGEIAYVQRTQATIEAARAALVRALQTIGPIHPLPGAANFLLLDTSRTGWRSGDLWAAMAQRRILVRDAATFPLLGSRYIRVAVRMPAENERLQRALAEVAGS